MPLDQNDSLQTEEWRNNRNLKNKTTETTQLSVSLNVLHGNQHGHQGIQSLLMWMKA